MILFLSEQRVFLQNLDYNRTSDVRETSGDGEKNWNFKSVMSLKKQLKLAFAVSHERCSASATMAARLHLRQLSFVSIWQVATLK